CGEDAHSLLLDLDPVGLVVLSALGDARQIFRKLLGDRGRTSLEEDGLHPLLVRGAPDVRALAVERPLQLLGGRRDVVREQELLLHRDANAFDVDARRLTIPAPEDAAE